MQSLERSSADKQERQKHNLALVHVQYVAGEDFSPVQLVISEFVEAVVVGLRVLVLEAECHGPDGVCYFGRKQRCNRKYHGENTANGEEGPGCHARVVAGRVAVYFERNWANCGLF